MAKESRVVQLQKDLLGLGYTDSLKALNWMIAVMNAGNGYKRHDGRHYYYHLVDATQDLINHGIIDETTITACILHDAIEDVPEITYEVVKSLFGVDVAIVVQGVTKNPDIDYKTDREAFNVYLKAILNNWRMLLVKTVDRKNNMGTLKDASPEKELRQALETEEYFLPLFKEGRKRYPQFSRFFHSAKTSLMPHILKIKQHHEMMENIKKYLREEIKRQEGMFGYDDHSMTVETILENVEIITKGGSVKVEM